MIKLGLILSLITSSSFALTTQECETQFIELGRGLTKAQIDPGCYNLAQENAQKISSWKLDGSSFEIFTVKNAIINKNINTEKIMLLSGEKSTLTDIIALDYNNARNEIFVLENNTGEIKSFSNYLYGNIAPARVLRTEQLIGTIDIAVNDKYIFAYNKRENNILVYQIEANYRVRSELQRIDLVTTYHDIPETVSSIHIEADEIILTHNDDEIEPTKIKIELN